MRNLCFATNNKGKLEEIQALLSGKFNILSLQDIGCLEELPETQPTIQGNSRQKAEFVAEKYKVDCFADDTGLEVKALNGEPGVDTAFYAGPQKSPKDNMDLLLKNLTGVNDRRARFVSVITLVMEGKVTQFEGAVEGTITLDKKGEKGFGYDPIFQPNGFSKTMAELTMDEKNQISHRGQAVRQLTDFLAQK
jgi:XTP/dITP diphosphohydrolase